MSGLAHHPLDVKPSHVDSDRLGSAIGTIGPLLDPDVFDSDRLTSSRLFLAAKEAGEVLEEKERVWTCVFVSQMLPRFTWKAYIDALLGDGNAGRHIHDPECFLRAFLQATPFRVRTLRRLLSPSFSRTVLFACAASVILDGVQVGGTLPSRILLGKVSTT